jgi:hypothetical protein
MVSLCVLFIVWPMFSSGPSIKHVLNKNVKSKNMNVYSMPGGLLLALGSDSDLVLTSENVLGFRIHFLNLPKLT